MYHHIQPRSSLQGVVWFQTSSPPGAEGVTGGDVYVRKAKEGWSPGGGEPMRCSVVSGSLWHRTHIWLMDGMIFYNLVLKGSGWGGISKGRVYVWMVCLGTIMNSMAYGVPWLEGWSTYISFWWCKCLHFRYSSRPCPCPLEREWWWCPPIFIPPLSQSFSVPLQRQLLVLDN